MKADLLYTFCQRSHIFGLNILCILPANVHVWPSTFETNFCENSIRDGDQRKNTQRLDKLLKKVGPQCQRCSFVYFSHQLRYGVG